MKLLTKEQQESYEEKIEYKYLKHQKHCKVRDHCHYAEKYRGAAHSIFNL